jgi:pSer/pThr/pTyr-binding forkhead associated (FHA) protein
MQRRDLSMTQPALVPVAGNYDKKPRSLEREVTTIGRARGSDLCMEANEISTLHCLIYRTAEGYRIRDCNSRCGTRVNGESIKSKLLHDTDIINLGPFSFEFRQPVSLFPKDGVRLDPVKVEHLKRSRRKLAQLAIKLRKRQGGATPRETEWAQKANLLKDKIRSYDQRLNELEEAEKELTDERLQLERAAEAQRRHVQEIETHLAKRLADAEDEIRQKWQEFQQRCHAEEVRAASTSQPEAIAHEASAALSALQQSLDDKNARLQQVEDQWARQQELWHREQQEFSIMKEQWAKDQADLNVLQEQQRMTLAEKEAAVRTQKAELLRMMGDIKKMQEDLRKQAKPDLRALQDEVERLTRENAELRQHAQPMDTVSGEMKELGEEVARLSRENAELREQRPTVDQSSAAVEQLHAEIALLRAELQSKDHLLRESELRTASTQNDASINELEQLRAENDLLKQILEEKASSEALPARDDIGENDLEQYESELNEYRRQLDSERTALNHELGTLRERNKELDEAIREMEMELSKERAELARERIRLERIREEVKIDMERLQREVAVRDSMAPVQKLRDELVQKKTGNERLRTMRDIANGS